MNVVSSFVCAKETKSRRRRRDTHSKQKFESKVRMVRSKARIFFSTDELEKKVVVDIWVAVLLFCFCIMFFFLFWFSLVALLLVNQLHIPHSKHINKRDVTS